MMMLEICVMEGQVNITVMIINTREKEGHIESIWVDEAEVESKSYSFEFLKVDEEF